MTTDNAHHRDLTHARIADRPNVAEARSDIPPMEGRGSLATKIPILPLRVSLHASGNLICFSRGFLTLAGTGFPVQPQMITRSVFEVLLAAQIYLGGLDRGVAEGQLNLLQ
jgi:hypothetical protein